MKVIVVKGSLFDKCLKDSYVYLSRRLLELARSEEFKNRGKGVKPS